MKKVILFMLGVLASLMLSAQSRWLSLIHI